MLLCLPDSTVRLFGGDSERVGQVQVLHNRTWWSVCADTFGVEEADVVCRKAGIRYW